jgi:hypothetical protein
MPGSSVGILAAALVALVVVGALAIAFAALAREPDERPRPKVVTIRS